MSQVSKEFQAMKRVRRIDNTGKTYRKRLRVTQELSTKFVALCMKAIIEEKPRVAIALPHAFRVPAHWPRPISIVKQEGYSLYSYKPSTLIDTLHKDSLTPFSSKDVRAQLSRAISHIG